ncbi:MAG: 50S ribosomal protein L13 [Vampirovibrionales bacterium]|nr:50S ribosomal protein L13 [Vampirovibrionales bacterium]
MQKTFMAKPEGHKDGITRNWVVIDATDMVLGRLSARIAQILLGKHKPTYTPHVDCGDFVVVINAEKVRVTGKKAEQKKYYKHSGYPGGLKTTLYKDLKATRPEKIVEMAVWRMLKHNRLNNQLIRHLNVYAGSEHPHTAQQPVLLAPEAFPLSMSQTAAVSA